MEPITLRFDSELLAELDDEADQLGFSSRSEYVRHLLRNRSEYELVTGPNTDVADSNTLHEELDELRERVERLEASGQRKPTTRREERAGGVAEGDWACEPTEALSELAVASQENGGKSDPVETRFREWLQHRPPEKWAAKEAVMTMFRELRGDGIMSTGELRSELFDRHGDGYKSEKSFWESIYRYVDDMPMFERQAGEWRFTSDEDVPK